MANPVHTDGTRFRDTFGRHIILRGVNLGGDCKLPATPSQPTFVPTDFADHRTVSFVGRPAPLTEIDTHLDRIAGWGFNALRLLTTWEAVEHQGPGEYDWQYLEYYAEICRRAGRRGLKIFVDFHQDAWSRMSGGSGAPGWTFEAAGLDFTRFDAADAANVMQYRYDPAIGGRQAGYPTMSWPANYIMPANGIMWPLFFAGARLVPDCKVDGVNIQHWLQDHYLGSVRTLASMLTDCDHVVGFGTLNEPNEGYLGHRLDAPIERKGRHGWSPLDGLAVASGFTRAIPILIRDKDSTASVVTVNPDRYPIWLPGREDPFRAAGAWDVDGQGEPATTRPDFFQTLGGETLDFHRDCLAPFFRSVEKTVRAERADWMMFLETNPMSAMMGETFPDDCPPRSVNANHWYDMRALITKHFDPAHRKTVIDGTEYVGADGVQRSYDRELGTIRKIGYALNGGSPTLIGEFGIQYDMNEAAAFAKWADGDHSPAIWDAQTQALETMYNSFDSLLLSSAQWNYTASNRNDPAMGDGWNQEDLSIFSPDQQIDAADPNSGARALDGFCRPFIRAAQGDIISQCYDRPKKRFIAMIAINPDIGAPTEIYLPHHIFGHAPAILAKGANWRLVPEQQLVLVRARAGGPLEIIVDGITA